jgi:hypothetical protein
MTETTEQRIEKNGELKEKKEHSKVEEQSSNRALQEK